MNTIKRGLLVLWMAAPMTNASQIKTSPTLELLKKIGSTSSGASDWTVGSSYQTSLHIDAGARNILPPVPRPEPAQDGGFAGSRTVKGFKYGWMAVTTPARLLDGWLSPLGFLLYAVLAPIGLIGGMATAIGGSEGTVTVRKDIPGW